MDEQWPIDSHANEKDNEAAFQVRGKPITMNHDCVPTGKFVGRPCSDVHAHLDITQPDLGSAMTITVNRLVSDGWESEGTIRFGFVFLHRNGTRRLLILTQRDPLDTGAQTFSPFK
jgi:hypothetical protein